MSGHVYDNYITIKELILIHVYVTGEEIVSSQGIEIVEQFALEEIPGPAKQSKRYRIRNNGEELFQHYRQKHPKLFEKQRLYTYEELKHRALEYGFHYLIAQP